MEVSSEVLVGLTAAAGLLSTLLAALLFRERRESAFQRGQCLERDRLLAAVEERDSARQKETDATRASQEAEERKKLASLRERSQNAEKEVNQLQEQIKQANQQVSKLRGQLKQANEAHAEERKALLDEKERSEKALAAERDRAHDREEKAAKEALERVETLKEELSSRLSRSAEDERATEELLARCEKAEAALKEKTATVEELETQLKQLETTLKEAKAEELQSREAHANLEAKITEVSSTHTQQLTDLKAELEEVRNALERAVRVNEELSSRLSRSAEDDKAQDELRARSEEAEASLKEKTAAMKELEAQVKRLEASVQELNVDERLELQSREAHADLQAKISELTSKHTKEVNELEQELEELRSEHVQTTERLGVVQSAYHALQSEKVALCEDLKVMKTQLADSQDIKKQEVLEAVQDEPEKELKHEIEENESEDDSDSDMELGVDDDEDSEEQEKDEDNGEIEYSILLQNYQLEMEETMERALQWKERARTLEEELEETKLALSKERSERAIDRKRLLATSSESDPDKEIEQAQANTEHMENPGEEGADKDLSEQEEDHDSDKDSESGTGEEDLRKKEPDREGSSKEDSDNEDAGVEMEAVAVNHSDREDSGGEEQGQDTKAKADAADSEGEAGLEVEIVDMEGVDGDDGERAGGQDASRAVEEVEGSAHASTLPTTFKLPREGTMGDLSQLDVRLSSEILREELKVKREKMSAKRTNVVKEILDTERSYVGTLDTICNAIISPLYERIKEGAPVLSQAEMKTIFGSIEVIRNYNAFFLDRLQERVQNWQESDCVGDLFLQVAQWLKTYSAYINNYDAALNLLSKVSKRVEVKRFMKLPAVRQACGKEDLPSMLIAPIQRIPRYVLLVQVLKDNTFREHADYDDVCAALEKMRGAADTVDAAKKRYDNMSKVFKIAERLGGDSSIVAPHRSFLSEAIFIRQAKYLNVADDEIPVKEIYVLLLFSDIIIVARPKAPLPAPPEVSSPRRRAGSGRRRALSSGRPGPEEQPTFEMELRIQIPIAGVELVNIEKQPFGIKFVSPSWTKKLYARSMSAKQLFMNETVVAKAQHDMLNKTREENSKLESSRRRISLRMPQRLKNT